MPDVGAHQLADVVVKYLYVTVENLMSEKPFGLKYLLAHVLIEPHHLVYLSVGELQHRVVDEE